MRRLISRTAAFALCVTVALGAAAAPCAAETSATPKAAAKLTRLSPATRQMLATATTARAVAAQAGATSSKSFFKTGKGKVTLALMGAGVGFTLWSIQHDRKPVKSPVR